MRHIEDCAILLAAALVVAGGPARAEGDAAAGESLFGPCKACHALEPGRNRAGPSLAGIVGRTAGTVAGYGYSDVMAGSGIIWDDEALDRYLADPKGFMPGNRMVFPGLKEQNQRSNVIAFLKRAAN